MPSMPVSSTAATTLYAGNLHYRSPPHTVLLYHPTPGVLTTTPRLYRNVMAWKFRNRIESKPMK
jgi:hypothetical protein